MNEAFGNASCRVPRETVDEIVLAPMRLVGDHDDIAPLRQHRMAVALLLRHELLDCLEHDTA
jgi:hypothetical protein